jgi:putative ABC transport system substrate-binding protein
VEVPDPGTALETAFQTARTGQVEALVVLGVPRFFPYQPRMAELSIAHRLPAMSAWRQLPDAGGLMSYGTNIDDLFRRSASYVDKILKGSKPADLPVERPTKFDFVINLKAAQALGLTIPQSVLIQATDVIQ